MIGFTQDYFTPFLLLLGGTAKDVGILSSLPNFFSALVQLKSADLTEKVGSRKKIINLFVFLQAIMLVPIAFVAMRKGTVPIAFIILVTFFTAFGAFAAPAWSSLMSDLVAEDKRGEYFGWRNKRLGFVIVGMSFLAGIILHSAEKNYIFFGFAVIFALAFVFRLISWNFLRQMEEPKLVHTTEDRFTLFRFLARIKESNFAWFVLFVSIMNFSVNLASPYFAVFMLRDLHFGYLLYSVITVTATLVIYLMMGRWGRHADKVGNLKVVKITAPIIATLPLCWVINRNPIFLLFVQILSGFAWAGFNLCASNFIYDAVTPGKRTRCISYFNVLNGLALCLGALMGGFIVQKLPPLFGYNILTLFVVSSSLRALVSILLPLRLKEVRSVQKVRDDQLLLSMIGIKPLFFFAQRMERNVASKQYSAPRRIIAAKPTSDPLIRRSRIE